MRAGVRAFSAAAGVRVPRRRAQTLVFRELSAAGRDAGPRLAHQRHHHQQLPRFHRRQVSTSMLNACRFGFWNCA